MTELVRSTDGKQASQNNTEGTVEARRPRRSEVLALRAVRDQTPVQSAKTLLLRGLRAFSVPSVLFWLACGRSSAPDDWCPEPRHPHPALGHAHWAGRSRAVVNPPEIGRILPFRQSFVTDSQRYSVNSALPDGLVIRLPQAAILGVSRSADT